MTCPAPPVRIGILGCADIVRRKVLPALAATPLARVALLGSRDPAGASARLPDAPCPITDYGQVLADRTIDLVYIALPNHLHEEWTLRALQAGKHVICEKPLGLDLASVRRMTATARATGQLLYENIMYLHHPQHRMVRELLGSGAIGAIRQFRANFCFTQANPGDFRLDPARGGGTFHDQARYPLTAALYHLQGALGDFHGVTRYRNGLDVAMSGCALSSSGELFTWTIAFDQPYEACYEIIGAEGAIRLDRAYTTPPDFTNSIIISRNGHQEARPVPAADHFQLMFAHVCQLIRTGDGTAQELHEIERRAEMAERMYHGCLENKS
jgi:predicted dehydrogenase